MDDISSLKAEFNLAAQLDVRKTTMHKRNMSHMTHSFVPSQIVIGRDDDKKIDYKSFDAARC